MKEHIKDHCGEPPPHMTSREWRDEIYFELVRQGILDNPANVGIMLKPAMTAVRQAQAERTAWQAGLKAGNESMRAAGRVAWTAIDRQAAREACRKVLASTQSVR